LVYILCLHFRLYFLLIPISFLSFNFLRYSMNKYVYLIKNKLVIWDFTGIIKHFNQVIDYNLKDGKLVLVLDNRDRIKIENKDANLLNIDELEKYLNS